MIRFPSQIEALQRAEYSGPQGAGGQYLRIVLGIVVVLLAGTSSVLVRADDRLLTEKVVKSAIDKGLQFLLQKQGANGTWPDKEYTVGKTSLALMTLIDCGLTADDEPVQRALKFLREGRPPNMTYQVALQIMALAAVKDGNRDATLMSNLATKLLRQQVKTGEYAGGWSYNMTESREGLGATDRSNSEFAIQALREAQFANIPIDRKTWELVREAWATGQGLDGGWNYIGSGPNNSGSTGSMTVAGITTQVIVESMLRDQPDENPDGSPHCCGQPEQNASLDRGLKWLEKNFTVGQNPHGSGGGLNYLRGVERAGRMTGRRFVGRHDWYREGAEFLIRMQDQRHGSWRGQGQGEQDEVVATCFALQFLSKGLAPVLINKLQYESAGADPKTDHSWNRHRHDIRNLTDLISGLPGWPKLVTWQQLDLRVVTERGGLAELMVSPVLYISGDNAPVFSPAEIALLRQYVLNGGFILGVATCTKTDFDRGFRDIVRQMYPEGESPLKRLTAQHPVFRSEYPIDPESTELWGVDVGGRTSLMYSPHDLACLWEKWSIVNPPKRSPQMKTLITQSTRVGINVMAYATSRKLPSPLANRQLVKPPATND